MRKLYLLLALLFSINYLAGQTPPDAANFTVSFTGSGLVVFNNTSVINDTLGKKAWWFFGDGHKQKTGPLAGAQHQYGPGVFNACLKIFKYSPSGNDSVITGEKCLSITIGNSGADSCKAYFVFRDTINPLTKLFKAEAWHSQQRPVERICWMFGDGKDTCIFPAAGTLLNFSVLHQYASPGSYNVCVKIKYQGGCESTTCKPVPVALNTSIDSCKADFLMDPVTATPMGRKFTAVHWSINQKKPVKVCWNFGNGRDTCINYPANHTGPYSVSYVYPQMGNYNVCVKIFYDGGCVAQKCKMVTIGQPPVDSCYVVLNEKPMSTASMLHRSFYVVTTPSRRPEQIKWIFGDGKDTTVNLPNPVTPQSLSMSHLYPHPGQYKVCVRVVFAGGCVREVCRYIFIAAPATAQCFASFRDSTIAPKTKVFTAQGTHPPGDSIISYKWTFGDGTTGTGKQVTKMYNHGGYYEVCLYMRTRAGCERKVCRRIAVAGPNLAQLHLSPNPVFSTLNLMFHSNKSETVSVRIYNSMGILVRSGTQTVMQGMNAWSYNVSMLVPGAYSVVVQSPTQFATAIFFKRN